MVQYEDPIPTRASKLEVSNFAESLASQFSFKPGEPIEPLVSQLDGAIAFRNPTGTERPESIRVEPDGTFRIFLPSVTSLGRDRFTIAHELGHFFLHFPLVQEHDKSLGMKATRWVDESNQSLQRCEWEANWFAASFIMPKKEFAAACKEYRNVKEIAATFAVTEAAVRVRAKSLGLEPYFA